MSQYVGKTISLVSKSDIRYVGTLHEINSEKSSVSLTQVVSYGTEGRLGGMNEIPPSPRIFEFIVFKGDDVKDLQVIEAPSAQIQAQQIQAQMQAAYYMSQQAQAVLEHSKQLEQSERPQQPGQLEQPKQSKQPKQPKEQSKIRPEPAKEPAQTKTKTQNVSVMMNRMSECQNAEQPRCLPSEHTNKSNTDEFDFVSSGQKFEDAVKSDRPAIETANVYNKKSSFFDNLSAPVDEDREIRRQRERELNSETFGESAEHYRSSWSRGRGRGRGRGGRGGRGARGNGNGRGRGRGNSDA